MDEILIVGCGDIGRRVALLEMGKGKNIRGLVHSREGAERLQALGIEPVIADLDDAATLMGLRTSGTLLYYFAPPPATGAIDTRIETVLSLLSSPNLPSRVVLISTTGVYGDCRGDWVTEDRPPDPGSDRALRRLSAERALKAWGETHEVPEVILRVPGIYGPSRLPLDRLRMGQPVLREEDAPYSNRIHADDLARVCVAAARRGRPGGCYNVSDGTPSTITDYFNGVADLVGLPRPPVIDLEEARKVMSPGMLSYLTESRRIDNRRMREELGVEPRYRNLAQGLPSCLDNSSNLE